MAVEENAQGDFVRDRFIEDPELEAKIEEMLDLKGSQKRYNKLNKEIAGRIEELDFPPGTRVVVGPFVAEIKQRSGGDIHIPPWVRNIPGPFKATND